jgi:hypothetical protein
MAPGFGFVGGMSLGTVVLAWDWRGRHAAVRLWWLLALAAFAGACGNGRIGSTQFTDAGVATSGNGAGAAGVAGSVEAGATGGTSSR